MSGEQKRRGLGRGLSALLGEVAAAVDDSLETTAAATAGTNAVRHVSVSSLVPGKFQPRQHFEEEALEALAESIREKGVLQPLLVRPHPSMAEHYEIIAGERRWRAAQQAKTHQVPVLIRELDDQQAAEVALIENLQRQDLSPLEEAEGYRRLQDEFSHTQEELSRAIGKSRSHIANMMRLLNLPDPVKTMLSEGALSAGHARALLTADDPVGLAQKVAERGLNVRQTEALAQKKDRKETDGGPSASSGRKEAAKDADTLALEKELAALLGLSITIDCQPEKEKGALVIRYGSLEQLDDLVERLRKTQSVEAVSETEDA